MESSWRGVAWVGALSLSIGCGGGEGEASSTANTSGDAASTSAAASTGDDDDGDPTPTTSGGTAGVSGSTTDPVTGSTGDASSDPGDPSTGEPPGLDPRLQALVTHAPRVWMPPDEEYFPSSVEFAFPFTTRFPDDEGNYWIRSTAVLDSPSDTLAFFAGDLDSAPVYAFYADKGSQIVDLVYFFYYPYNRGKEVVDTIWGNHVGDWEHITVRTMRGADDVLTPVQVYLSAHSFGGVYDWAAIEHHDETHPVVYSAWGSHGVWDTPGAHVYQTIGEEVLGVCVTLVCADLTDDTAAGIAWDTWERVAGFDYGAKEGLGDQVWPVWMSEDFTAPGADPITVPGGGPIFRWGNTEDCSTLGIDIGDLIGVCRLEDGPTGPASKGVWGPELQ